MFFQQKDCSQLRSNLGICALVAPEKSYRLCFTQAVKKVTYSHPFKCQKSIQRTDDDEATSKQLQRYAHAHDQVTNSRTQLLSILQTIREGRNPLGLEDGDIPLYLNPGANNALDKSNATVVAEPNQYSNRQSQLDNDVTL